MRSSTTTAPKRAGSTTAADIRATMRRLIVPAVLTLAAFAVLVSLGNWQLRRLAWKEEHERLVRTEKALGLVRNPASRMDVLGHPMGISTKNFGGFPEPAMRTLMTTCREHGVAFEISTKYCTDLGQLVRLLRETAPDVDLSLTTNGLLLDEMAARVLPQKLPFAKTILAWFSLMPFTS